MSGKHLAPFAATLLLAFAVTARLAWTSPAATQPQGSVASLITLSSQETIGLQTVCRIRDVEAGAIEVTLSTGSVINLASAADVQLVKGQLSALQRAGKLNLFEPVEGVVINLNQTTNIWSDESGLTFWGMDGRAFVLPGDVDRGEVMKRVKIASDNWVHDEPFIDVIPSLLVNPALVGHVSIVDGKLRFFMANKTWPMIEVRVDIDSAKKALARSSLASDVK